MNIQEAKNEIRHTLRAYFRKDGEGRYLFPAVRQRPVLLMGPPGVGKTAILEQIAAEAGVGLVSYTMTHHTRQSAVGLPRIETRVWQGETFSVTEYTLSEVIASVYACMERTGKREGVLFIDEINCVSETLAPAMLQFLQNKTFGNHRVPEGWLIVAAGNPPEYNRSVREFDVVTLDRVRQIDVEPDLPVWLDYARQRRLHGAVLSYLSIRSGQFYQVRRTPEGVSFVTARGWEDLSELIKAYEELDVPVTEAQVRQYLQNDDTARGFAGYYQLYRKYGAAYAIPEILDGSRTDASSGAAMARAASMDERFTVVNLMLDCLNSRLALYEQTDRNVTALHRTLETFKLFMKDKPDICCLDDFLRGRRDALAVRREAELLTPGELETEDWVLGRLEAYSLALKAAHIQRGTEGFQYIKTLFEQETAARAALVGTVKDQLDRAFAFLSDCFGEGQEMILFVSALTRMERAMDFIALHGCTPYLEYSQTLLYREREAQLQSACAGFLAEKG